MRCETRNSRQRGIPILKRLQDERRLADSSPACRHDHACTDPFFAKLELPLQCADFLLPAKESHDDAPSVFGSKKLNAVKIFA